MPGDAFNETGLHIIRSPNWLNLNEDEDTAAALVVSVDHDVLLDSIAVPLRLFAGVNELDIYLVGSEPTTDTHPTCDPLNAGLLCERPDTDLVIEQWHLVDRAPGARCCCGGHRAIDHPSADDRRRALLDLSFSARPGFRDWLVRAKCELHRPTVRVFSTKLGNRVPMAKSSDSGDRRPGNGAPLGEQPCAERRRMSIRSPRR